MRQRHTLLGAHPPSPRLGPGDLVFEVARRFGWPLGSANIMVEGTQDVEYYRLAAMLYEKVHQRQLLGKDLSLFAVGEGQAGGTLAITNKFRTLRDVLTLDPRDGNGQQILVVCLVDYDLAGRKLCHYLKQAGFVQYRDFFPLQRRMPSSTRAPQEFECLIKRDNQQWHDLDCEIEDLLDRSLLEFFVQEHPQALRREPTICGEAHHYEFAPGLKSELVRFAKAIASPSDLVNIVDVLRAMRFALGLVPDGLPV